MKTGLKIALGIGGVIGGYYLLKNLGTDKEDTDTLEDSNENLQLELETAQSTIEQLQAQVQLLLDNASGDDITDLSTIINGLEELSNSIESADNNLTQLYDIIYSDELDEEGNVVGQISNLETLQDLINSESNAVNDIQLQLSNIENQLDALGNTENLSQEDLNIVYDPIVQEVLELINAANEQQDLSSAIETYLEDDSGQATLAGVLDDYFASPSEGEDAGGAGFERVQDIVESSLPNQIDSFFDSDDASSTIDTIASKINTDDLDIPEGGDMYTSNTFATDVAAEQASIQEDPSLINETTILGRLDDTFATDAELDEATKDFITESDIPDAEISATDLATAIEDDLGEGGDIFGVLDDKFATDSQLNSSIPTASDVASEIDLDQIADSIDIPDANANLYYDLETGNLGAEPFPSEDGFGIQLTDSRGVPRFVNSVYTMPIDVDAQINSAIANLNVSTSVQNFLNSPDGQTIIDNAIGTIDTSGLTIQDVQNEINDTVGGVSSAIVDLNSVINRLVSGLPTEEISVSSVDPDTGESIDETISVPSSLSDTIPEYIEDFLNEEDEDGNTYLENLITNNIDVNTAVSAFLATTEGQNVIQNFLQSEEGLTILNDQISSSSTIGDIQSDIRDIQGDIESAETDIDTVQSEVFGNEDEGVRGLVFDLGNLDTEVDTLQTNVDNIQTTIQNNIGNTSNLEFPNQSIASNIQDLQQRVSDLEGGQSIEELNNQIDNTTSPIDNNELSNTGLFTQAAPEGIEYVYGTNNQLIGYTDTVTGVTTYFTPYTADDDPNLTQNQEEIDATTQTQPVISNPVQILLGNPSGIKDAITTLIEQGNLQNFNTNNCGSPLFDAIFIQYNLGVLSEQGGIIYDSSINASIPPSSSRGQAYLLYQASLSACNIDVFENEQDEDQAPQNGASQPAGSQPAGSQPASQGGFGMSGDEFDIDNI